jgi:hypothetical protein
MTVGMPFLFTRSIPIDFILFLKIREKLKSRYFDDTDDIRSNAIIALKSILENEFQNCFEA